MIPACQNFFLDIVCLFLLMFVWNAFQFIECPSMLLFCQLQFTFAFYKENFAEHSFLQAVDFSSVQ